MIKIPSSGCSAAIKTSTHRKSVSGQFGDGVKQCNFQLGTATLLAKWVSRQISIEIICEEETYVEQVALNFEIKSPKPSSETVIWSEALTDSFPIGLQHDIPGTETRKQKRQGAWAMWISESSDSEGLLFGQTPPAEYPVSFTYNPSAKSIELTWIINRAFSTGEQLTLSEISLRKGLKDVVVKPWRKKWTDLGTREFPQNQCRGWLGGSEIKSLEDLKECALSARQFGFNWFAIGSNFAQNIGDWLLPKGDFQDRMGHAFRILKDTGLLPGLRFSPFLVSRTSKIAAEHREWMVMNENDSPVQYSQKGRETLYILDSTNPQVLKHIHNMFTKMRDRWGFRVYALEHFDALSYPGKRFDQKIGYGSILSSASAMIRNTLGSKCLLVGMNVPLLGTIGIWDILTQTPAAEASAKNLQISGIASGIIHRSPWNNRGWINAPGPMSVELLFKNSGIAQLSLRSAVQLASGALLLSGDPRKLNASSQVEIRQFIEMFNQCRNGKLHMGNISGGGRDEPMIVRNDRGWVGLFNFSRNRKEVRLKRESLKSSHGVKAALSSGDGAVFNSPEIVVALDPWGHRLFRG